MEDFKTGDVVKLKSGGPLMTVYDVTRKAITCQWFDEKKEIQYSKFSAETLEKS